jgi:4-hydroxybenzoate polyprenyltransferase
MCWGIAFTLSPLGAGEAMQRLGLRALWLLCLVVALVVAALHVLTAGPRRSRLAALSPPPSERDMTSPVGV